MEYSISWRAFHGVEPTLHPEQGELGEGRGEGRECRRGWREDWSGGLQVHVLYMYMNKSRTTTL